MFPASRHPMIFADLDSSDDEWASDSGFEQQGPRAMRRPNPGFDFDSDSDDEPMGPRVIRRPGAGFESDSEDEGLDPRFSRHPMSPQGPRFGSRPSANPFVAAMQRERQARMARRHDFDSPHFTRRRAAGRGYHTPLAPSSAESRFRFAQAVVADRIQRTLDGREGPIPPGFFEDMGRFALGGDMGMSRSGRMHQMDARVQQSMGARNGLGGRFGDAEPAIGMGRGMGYMGAGMGGMGGRGGRGFGDGTRGGRPSGPRRGGFGGGMSGRFY